MKKKILWIGIPFVLIVSITIVIYSYVNNGKKILYYESGEIWKEGNYKNGKQDGNWITYYKNGQIKSECSYKRGSFAGCKVLYYDNGQIEQEIKNGCSVSYYENGQIKEEDKPGRKIKYYEDGQIKEELILSIGENCEWTDEGANIKYFQP